MPAAVVTDALRVKMLLDYAYKLIDYTGIRIWVNFRILPILKF